jgi:alpha-tubulin suppressor-like RCC1 family protein
VGGSHACARRAEGSVVCWGTNASGQLGNGGTVDSAAPVQVVGLRNAKSIVARVQHTCVIDANDDVQCWGANQACVLGYCGNPSYVPVAIAGLSHVKHVALGLDHACALKTDGNVLCWGNQSGGALGNGIDASTGKPTPAQVAGIAQASEIAAGVGWSCALSNGIYCWGRNRYADVTDLDSLTPFAIMAPPGLADLTAGQSHLCARATNAVLCRGSNLNGELGDGTYSHTAVASGSSSSFVTVKGLTNATELSADLGATCALTSDERVLCWGGDGGGTVRNVPTEIVF